MIDYVKILLTRIDVERLSNLRKLDFKTEVSEKTGEVIKRTAHYHFCKITIYNSGTAMFTGSIHKLWNSLNNILAPNYREWKIYKGYNGNQFTTNNIMEVREHLQQLFNCTPKQMIFQNIEFGINTIPKFNPQLFLKGLLYHNGESFEFRHKEHFAQAIHQRYYLKIYNKSTQYGIQEHTLRVELKVIKTEDIKCLGVKTFADINTCTLEKANKLLLKRFDEVVYYDNTIRKNNLTERQKQTLERYSNPRYWIDTLTKQNRFHHKNKLHLFIVKHSDNLHQKLRQEIQQKGLPINHLSEIEKSKNTLPINRYSKSTNTLLINRSSIGLKSIFFTSPKKAKKKGCLEIKKCVVTGIDLSMEKEGSKYIKRTTLKHLEKHCSDVFEKLYSEFCGMSVRMPKYELSRVSHLNKQIRNKFYNSNKLKRIGYKHKIYDNPHQLKIVI